jgi:hypothetical protein
MKKYDVVVARYKEDLNWLDQLDPEKYNLVIYNKGPSDIKYPFIPSENIGLMSQTMINYIVQHYDNLPEFVIFVQGYPFDHCVSTVERILEHIDEKFTILCDDVFVEDIAGWYEPLIKRPDGYPLTTLRDTTYSLLGNNAPTKLKFGSGEQYIVHSSLIKNRSKEFYENLLERYKTDYLLPWHVERLYLYIFGVE